jgi:hypothetical protein
MGRFALGGCVGALFRGADAPALLLCPVGCPPPQFVRLNCTRERRTTATLPRCGSRGSLCWLRREEELEKLLHGLRSYIRTVGQAARRPLMTDSGSCRRYPVRGTPRAEPDASGLRAESESDRYG